MNLVHFVYQRFQLEIDYWIQSPYFFLIHSPLLQVTILVSIAALFIIVRTWKQPRCPSADEWIRKLWYIYTMEYYSARYWMLGAGALGWPRGIGWDGRWERGSGWRTHVHLWRIHANVWQNQHNIVKKKKIHSFQYIYGEIFTRRKSCLIKSKSGCCRRLKQGEDANKKTQKIKLKNN